MAMNARESENYLPISRSSIASKEWRHLLVRDISGTTFFSCRAESSPRVPAIVTTRPFSLPYK